MKGFKRLLAIAGIAVALAGCQTANGASGDYRFELVGQPVFSAGSTTVSVRLVHADGSPIHGAELYAEHWVDTGAKGAPSRNQRIPLHADGHGSFTYSSDGLHEGDTLRLEARITPDSSLIYGSVEVP